MYNLIEYSNNCAKTSGNLWQYYGDEPNDSLADSESFKSKIKITGKTPDDGNEKDVEIMVPLKYLSNFWRTLEIKYFKDSYRMIVVDLSKHQILESDPRGVQQINFTVNLDRASKRNYFKFCTRHCKCIVNMLCNNFKSNIK